MKQQKREESEGKSLVFPQILLGKASTSTLKLQKNSFLEKKLSKSYVRQNPCITTRISHRSPCNWGSRQIQHRQVQGNSQEQAHLSDAEWAEDMWPRGAGAPSLVQALLPANQKVMGQNDQRRIMMPRARNAARSGPCPTLPCIRRNRSRWARECHSRAHMWQASSPGERSSTDTLPARSRESVSSVSIQDLQIDFGVRSKEISPLNSFAL
jgi:hypothetical protein